MRYAIISATGFHMSGSVATIYNTEEEARKHMTPGDQMVPLVTSEDVVVSTGEQKPTSRIGKINLFF